MIEFSGFQFNINQTILKPLPLGVKTYKKKKERKKKKNNRIASSVEIHEVEFILPKLFVRYQNEVCKNSSNQNKLNLVSIHTFEIPACLS